MYIFIYIVKKKDQYKNNIKLSLNFQKKKLRYIQ